MGNNSSGFVNEDELFQALNGKYYPQLNGNMQEFICFVNNCSVPRSKIIAEKTGGQEKCDLVIVLDGKRTKVSIKKGAGNSVHQEPLETFISYLRENYTDFFEYLADDIRFFIWGDGTLDGKGKKEHRMRASEIAGGYPEKIKRIKIFLKKHKRELIKRFLLEGITRNSVDFIFYGNSEAGLWALSEEVLELLCSEKYESKRITLPVGGLSLQAWNRAIGDTAESTERKRGVIQAKWGKLQEHLEIIKRNRESR